MMTNSHVYPNRCDQDNREPDAFRAPALAAAIVAVGEKSCRPLTAVTVATAVATATVTAATSATAAVVQDDAHSPH
jgi:hypothetical protein